VLAKTIQPFPWQGGPWQLHEGLVRSSRKQERRLL
jgi:hypothetical protein